jgi:hypothetical protein
LTGIIRVNLNISVGMLLTLGIIPIVTVVAQEQQWQTHTDPQNRFTISHSSGWTVDPATNRFEGMDVRFTSPQNPSLTVGINVMEDLPVYNKEDDSAIEIAMLDYISGLQDTFPNLNIFQDVECNEYSMNGQSTCSFIYTHPDSSGIQNAVLEVSILDASNSRIFMLSYANSQDAFDADLPIVEQMINSFRIIGDK